MTLLRGSHQIAFRDDILLDVRDFLVLARRQPRPGSRPVTTLSYAQSIDGSISLNNGRTLQLSNPVSQTLTHQIRSLHDGILVGINTILTDDPRLTVRLAQGEDPQPIVVDSRLRFPVNARLLKDSKVPPIIATCDRACSEKESQLIAAGAQVLRLPATRGGRVSLSHLMARLGSLGMTTLMVEGGAGIITNILRSSLADQLIVTISPRFVGGLRAVKRLPAATSARLAHLCNVHFANLAGDLIIRGDFAPDLESSVADAQTAAYPRPPDDGPQRDSLRGAG